MCPALTLRQTCWAGAGQIWPLTQVPQNLLQAAAVYKAETGVGGGFRAADSKTQPGEARVTSVSLALLTGWQNSFPSPSLPRMLSPASRP